MQTYPLVNDLEDFKKAENVGLKNYSYKDLKGVIHPNIQTYKEELIQKILTNHTNLLERKEHLFSSKKAVKGVVCDMMESIINIKNLAASHQAYYLSFSSHTHESPQSLEKWGLYKK